MPEEEVVVEAAEAVVAAEATEAVVVVETPQAGILLAEASLLGVVGATFSVILMPHHHLCVKNIIYTGSLHIGVKSQHHVRGRTSSFQRINEILTSLRLVTT